VHLLVGIGRQEAIERVLSNIGIGLGATVGEETHTPARAEISPPTVDCIVGIASGAGFQASTSVSPSTLLYRGASGYGGGALRGADQHLRQRDDQALGEPYVSGNQRTLSHPVQ